MSNLRVVGIIVGILGLLVIFLVYRGPKWKKGNFILFTLFNLSLVAVCVDPNLVNFLRDMLALQEYKYGRLFTLLIMSTIFLLFYSFETRYMLVPRSYVKRLKKSRFFRKNFIEVSSDERVVLYEKITNRRYSFVRKDHGVC